MAVDFARVDPEALQSMHNKIKKLQEELDHINKRLKGEVLSLHNQGFKDKKFVELENTMNLHNSAVLNLIRFMEKYTKYLKDQESALMRYINSKKL
jgi:hypothetical protein